jgi:hypothetical protein
MHRSALLPRRNNHILCQPASHPRASRALSAGAPLAGQRRRLEPALSRHVPVAAAIASLRDRDLPLACFPAVISYDRWLPFSLTTVLVGADFIVLTSRIPGGLVDHVHQARAQLPAFHRRDNRHLCLCFAFHQHNNHHLCYFSPHFLAQIVQGTWILSNFTWVVGDLFFPDDRVCALMDFECNGDRYQLWSNVLSTVTPNCNLPLLLLLPSHMRPPAGFASRLPGCASSASSNCSLYSFSCFGSVVEVLGCFCSACSCPPQHRCCCSISFPALNSSPTGTSPHPNGPPIRFFSDINWDS